MSDYIKRDVLVQAFMDELLDEIPFSLKRELAEKMVDNIPKADAVEVIRCKDCKYWKSDLQLLDLAREKLVAPCPLNERDSFEDGYCELGEREDND